MTAIKRQDTTKISIVTLYILQCDNARITVNTPSTNSAVEECYNAWEYE